MDQGLILLDSVLHDAANKRISGKKAFELYDTFGFPMDLTALIAKERGFDVDEEAFHLEMEKQKARSRKAAASVTDDWTVLRDDDAQEFVGYDLLSTPIKITRYRKVNTAKEGTFLSIGIQPYALLSRKWGASR